MDERFADLSPITYAEYENIAQLALCFFSPLQNKQFRQIAESGNEDRIIPLNENNFFSFLCKIDKTYDKKLHKIKRILSLMERAEILTFEGNGNSALLGRHYYSLKELTNLQRRNSLWLGEAFGFPFLQEKLKANVIHITGITKQGDTGNGTGFLINRNTILTCKHVISDMIPDDNLTILEKNIHIKSKNPKSTISHCSSWINVLIALIVSLHSTMRTYLMRSLLWGIRRSLVQIKIIYYRRKEK